MKILNLIPKAAIALSLITAITISSCSSSSDDAKSPPAPQPSGPVNSGSLNLIAIDTAKVIKMNENGSSPVVVLNRNLNQNSYMSDFCFSPDGTKFIYVDVQASGVVPNFVRSVKLKIANINGTSDTDLFTAQNALQGSEISSIKYCSDGKIFFAYKMATASGNAFASTYNTINPDGTGLTNSNPVSGQYFSVSNDRRFYITNATAVGTTTTNTIIYDKTLDGGAGGVYHIENSLAGSDLGNPSITNDGKYVVIPFKIGNEIKLRIVDMATKTGVTKSIVTGLASNGYDYFRFHMASDNIRGVLTVGGQNSQKSKSYVFNTSTGVASTPFENNDENVVDVFAY